MINGISWLVVTKLDVLDEFDEIPVCVGYKIDGKETDEIPAQACGYRQDRMHLRKDGGLEDIDRRHHALEKLPKAAREYLAFLEKETERRRCELA